MRSSCLHDSIIYALYWLCFLYSLQSAFPWLRIPSMGMLVAAVEFILYIICPLYHFDTEHVLQLRNTPCHG